MTTLDDKCTRFRNDHLTQFSDMVPVIILVSHGFLAFKHVHGKTITRTVRITKLPVILNADHDFKTISAIK